MPARDESDEIGRHSTLPSAESVVTGSTLRTRVKKRTRRAAKGECLRLVISPVPGDADYLSQPVSHAEHEKFVAMF